MGDDRHPLAHFQRRAAIAPPSGRAVDAALADLRATAMPWFWFQLPDTPGWVTERVGAARAAVFDDRSPWMEAPRDALPPPEPLPGIELEEAVDEDGWRRWAAAMCGIYAFPPAGEPSWIELHPLAQASAPVAGFWATELGVPLYASLGFRERGWITRWLGGMP